jgi:lysylphosphatidylglycerol synthetase-like protein (DUF2156 family)
MGPEPDTSGESVVSADTLPIPPPRAGFLGRWDTLIGPGSTAAEQGLVLGTALAGAGVAVWSGRGLEWTPAQWVVVVIIALDLFGGVPGNATASSRRWYNRTGQGLREHFIFIAVHLFHLLPITLFFDTGWLWIAGAYAYLLTAATVILRVSEYLRNALALVATSGGILLALYGLPDVPGLAWLLPVFYLKLLAGHLGTGNHADISTARSSE